MLCLHSYQSQPWTFNFQKCTGHIILRSISGKCRQFSPKSFESIVSFFFSDSPFKILGY